MRGNNSGNKSYEIYFNLLTRSSTAFTASTLATYFIYKNILLTGASATDTPLACSGIVEDTNKLVVESVGGVVGTVNYEIAIRYNKQYSSVIYSTTLTPELFIDRVVQL